MAADAWGTHLDAAVLSTGKNEIGHAVRDARKARGQARSQSRHRADPDIIE